jgi:hypothetical protein
MVNSATSPTPVVTQPPATSVPLAQAAVEVQLAVELILLLEQQQLPSATVLAALDIVKADFLRQASKAAANVVSTE